MTDLQALEELKRAVKDNMKCNTSDDPYRASFVDGWNDALRLVLEIVAYLDKQKSPHQRTTE